MVRPGVRRGMIEIDAIIAFALLLATLYTILSTTIIAAEQLHVKVETTKQMQTAMHENQIGMATNCFGRVRLNAGRLTRRCV